MPQSPMKSSLTWLAIVLIIGSLLAEIAERERQSTRLAFRLHAAFLREHCEQALRACREEAR